MCLVRGRDVTIRRVVILIAVNCTTQMRRKEFARIISGYWHALRVATFQRCFQTPRLICHILRWPRHFARQLMSLYCLASLFTILFNFGLSSRLSILDRCALIEINANRDISAKHDSCPFSHTCVCSEDGFYCQRTFTSGFIASAKFRKSRSMIVLFCRFHDVNVTIFYFSIINRHNK